jgi:hypothetical protein
MSYSKEDFEQFSKKLEEIRKSQKDDFIAPNAWEEIAEEIGFPTSELRNIQNAYKMRGIGHLQHRNWTEALKELQNYLIFNPLDPEANALLAEAHLGKWVETEKKEDAQKARIYADKCLSIDPAYKKAFQIIQQLNRPEIAQEKEREKKKNKHNAIRKAPFVSKEKLNIIAFSTMLVLIILSPAIYYLITYRIPINITFYQTVANDKKAVTWMFTYEDYDDSHHNHQIQILEAQSGKLITKFPLDASVQDFSYINGKFYYQFPSKKDFEARDAFTGELVDNKKILTSHFKQLAQGIGDIRISNENIELTRKDGAKFSYRLEYDLLLSSQEADDLSYFNKSGNRWIYKYNWVRLKNTKNSAENQFYLYKTLEKPDYKRFNPDSYSHFGLPENTQFSTRIGFKSPTFLDATPLYADSTFFLVKHKSEISEEAKLRLTAMSDKGTVLWELKEEESPKSMIWLFLSKNNYKYFIQRQSNELLLSSAYVYTKDRKDSFALTMTFDAQSGKLLWQYSPNNKFE